MVENPKRRPYYARMEYRAVQPEVEAMRERGCSVKMIYEELTKSGRLTISYKSFCDYVCGGGQRVYGKKKTAPKQSLNPGRAAATKSQSAQQKSDRPENSSVYIREKTPLEDLI